MYELEKSRSSCFKYDYNLVFNNCEHFVTECATGKKESQQVQAVTLAAVDIAVDIGVRAAGYGSVIDGLAAAFIPISSVTIETPSPRGYLQQEGLLSSLLNLFPQKVLSGANGIS